jgi:APA family basic amino acid/polyamine antiporter
MAAEVDSRQDEGTLAREMGLLGLVATGVCSMVGAGINVIPIMVQRNVPGIGPNVTFAFALAMVPAVLAALSYPAMASAMPRAGGSYVYASRLVLEEERLKHLLVYADSDNPFLLRLKAR